MWPWFAGNVSAKSAALAISTATRWRRLCLNSRSGSRKRLVLSGMTKTSHPWTIDTTSSSMNARWTKSPKIKFPRANISISKGRPSLKMSAQSITTTTATPITVPSAMVMAPTMRARLSIFLSLTLIFLGMRATPSCQELSLLHQVLPPASIDNKTPPLRRSTRLAEKKSWASPIASHESRKYC